MSNPIDAEYNHQSVKRMVLEYTEAANSQQASVPQGLAILCRILEPMAHLAALWIETNFEESDDADQIEA